MYTHGRPLVLHKCCGVLDISKWRRVGRQCDLAGSGR